jgi:rubrerythrin
LSASAEADGRALASAEADRRASELTLGDIDRDEAILESIAGLYGDTRAQLLKKAAFGGGVLFAALAASPSAEAGNVDVPILNFDLAFEYLQSSFYVSAADAGTVRRMAPEKRQWARVLGAHELAHVRILEKVLGERAVKKPFFDFRGVDENEDAFTRTAVAMEDLTTALLAGQAPRLTDKNLVAAVFSLLTTEARHAAWARRLAGFTPVVSPFDEPKPISEVRRVVRRTRFIAARPRTRSRKRPNFTG